MPQNPEEFALAIVRRLQVAGHIAYFAGGCVRDRLMGREPKDFDIATSALPNQVLTLFPRSQLVGAAFGVIIVRERKFQVEVATFRAEGIYTDGRRPDSVSFTTPEIDARRRDFTCNGIFFDPVANQIHDFVNGRADIEAKLLRAIGEPRHRFAEDHLRMMRAVRFAAKLDFQIEPATFQAIRDHYMDIQRISSERIGEEMRMMLEHPSRTIAAKMLSDSILLWAIWPDIWRRAPENWNALAALNGNVSRALGLAAMHVDISIASAQATDWPLAARLFRHDFVLSNQEHEELVWIGETAERLFTAPALTRAQLKRLIADPRWPVAVQFFEAWSRDAAAIADLHKKIAAMLAEGGAPPPLVTGEDLIALGAIPGKKFKQWLETLYDRQLELEFPTRDAALIAAKQLIAQGG